jgi:hypothetical protein
VMPPDGVRQWLKEKPWSLEVFTKDFECKWSPCEGDGYNTEYIEERKEFIKNRINIEKSWLWNHMKLKVMNISTLIFVPSKTH